MKEAILITGVPTSEQIKKAKAILDAHVLPKSLIFERRKAQGKLRPELMRLLKANA